MWGGSPGASILEPKLETADVWVPFSIFNHLYTHPTSSNKPIGWNTQNDPGYQSQVDVLIIQKRETSCFLKEQNPQPWIALNPPKNPQPSWTSSTPLKHPRNQTAPDASQFPSVSEVADRSLQLVPPGARHRPGRWKNAGWFGSLFNDGILIIMVYI